MRVPGVVVCAFLVLGLSAPPNPGEAGEVPSPLFHDSEAAFLAHVDEGQFNALLELHLTEYSADPRWALDWAASRYAGNGLFGEYGSTGSRRLYTDTQIALNAFPAERVQLRYDRRLLQDDRFDLRDERLDALWYPAAGWAVLASGWPTNRKQEASLGLGARLGAPKSEDGLVALVMDERAFWNEKTQGGVRFTRQPTRLLVDGHRGSGPWRLSGSADWGLEYRTRDHPSAGAALTRSTRGYLRLADLGAEFQGHGWAAGGRASLVGNRFEQDEDAGSRFFLDRVYGRLRVDGRVEAGKLTGYGVAVFAWQDDDFRSPAAGDGSYRLRAWILGAEGGVQVLPRLEARLGYLGSLYRMQRDASACGDLDVCLRDREQSRYADKAHVRALYEFGPRMSLELLLSQTVTGSRFGGGSAKALVVF